MTRRLAPAVLFLVLALGGCVYYPTIPDIGGIRIRPMNGRAVRESTGLVLYMDLDSTGKYGDAVVAVLADVAKSAVLVDQAGQTVPRLEVPGTTLVRLFPQGPHIVLTELARPVQSGETLLVTLVFERIGNVGAITRVE
jgi:copper(I)-binding protein